MQAYCIYIYGKGHRPYISEKLSLCVISEVLKKSIAAPVGEFGLVQRAARVAA